MEAFKCDGCEEYTDGDSFTLGELCSPCVQICHKALDVAIAAEVEPELPPGNWISVKDAVPIHDREVCVVFDEAALSGKRFVWRCCYSADGWCWPDDMRIVHRSCIITHWRPVNVSAS